MPYTYGQFSNGIPDAPSRAESGFHARADTHGWMRCGRHRSSSGMGAQRLRTRVRCGGRGSALGPAATGGTRRNAMRMVAEAAGGCFRSAAAFTERQVREPAACTRKMIQMSVFGSSSRRFTPCANGCSWQLKPRVCSASAHSNGSRPQFLHPVRLRSSHGQFNLARDTGPHA